MSKNIPLLFFLFFSFTASAQQNNIWYFGRQAGLDFNSQGGQPVPTALQNSAMNTDEGCSTICDDNGNLLFYTNGITVYNKEHNVMQNGDNLLGNKSACQSGLIVPQPGGDSLFYIFTTDAIENNFANGYNYSIVNMKKDNGRGSIVVKNQLLSQSCTERMTAARHANGVDIWLITNDNNSNTFRSWLITCNGLQTAPIVSNAGIVMNFNVLTNTGYMKVSPDGKQLCHTFFPLGEEVGGVSNFIQLFNFDNNSGIISGGIKVTRPNASYIGCEYSPDSKYIYLTRPTKTMIDQIEAKLATSAAIEASAVSMPTPSSKPFGIQLGPDEKIYVFNESQNVGVINNPNNKAPNVGFNEAQISTSPHTAYLSSPSFMNDVAFDPNNSFTYTLLGGCDGQVQFTSFSSMPGNVSWFWDFGDGSTSTLQNPMHVFTPSDQTYTVSLTMSSNLSCANIKRSRLIQPAGISGEVSYDFTIRCDSDYVRFTNTSKTLLDNNVQFVWDFGDGATSTDVNPIHTYSVAGQYNVKLSTTAGSTCSIKELTQAVNIVSFQIAAPADVTVLVGNPVYLSASGPPVEYAWSPAKWLSDTASKNTIATPLEDIKYIVTGTNSDGCHTSDSVFIKVIQYDNVYVPSAFTPNNDGKNETIKPYFPGTVTLDAFIIFDRWGNKVFSSNERSTGWDGTFKGANQPNGVYVWTFSGKDTKTNQANYKKGTVTLIR